MKQRKTNITGQHNNPKYPTPQKEANYAAKKTKKTRKWHREKPAKKSKNAKVRILATK